ncbi:hypothetical protein HA402_015927 [Bradysia odoriphaga]|nr:hypothetical protein HA402_015927 [Bradysia odoriphaga]
MHSVLTTLLMTTTFSTIQIEWNSDNSSRWCAFSGNDLSNALTKSEDCQDLCTSTYGCTHYTWTDYNSGTCFMKTNKVSRADAFLKLDQNTLCGIVSDSDNQLVDWNGSDSARWCAFSGNDLTNTQSKSEDCANKCASTRKCTHFTWTDFNSGTCWMKTNNVSKSEAFPKNDQNAVCGVVGLSGGRSITFLNRCNFPIWINPFPILGNGIQRLEQNARTTCNIPDSGWRGRVWPKTGCDNNGQNCAVGQSIPPCPSTGCQPPAETKVEFFYPASIDRIAVWYDISLVDGYSLPMEIIPDKQEGSCVTTNCAMKLDSCPSNENLVGDLRIIRNDRVVQCLAPCKKWNYPPPYGMGKSERIDPGLHLCCPTPPISPQECTAGIVTQTQYVNLIHRDCPTAYSYAYDDEGGLHNCPNPTNFNVNIC